MVDSGDNSWDHISVEEIQELIANAQDFYAERDNPRMSAFWLADLILKRLHNDLDYYINCEGQKGYGKSNLMLLLALLQARYAGIYKNMNTGKIVKVLPRDKPLTPEWKMQEFSFRFKKNMSFLDNTNDIKLKYNALDKYMPFVIDEGSKNLHKYQWQSKTQFMLVKLSDSVGKDSEICFYEGDKFKRMTIENMYKKYGEEPTNLFTWTIGDDKKCVLKKLNAIIQKPLRKRMFKITSLYNKEIILTEDHGLYIYRDGQVIKESPLNLTLKDKVILPLTLPAKETIKEDNDMMQLYGAWIADGNYRPDYNKKKTLCAVEISGKEHLPLIQRICKKNNINYYIQKNGVDISINSIPFTKEFKEKGFDGNSYTKRIPDWIYNTSKENKIAFLKGLFTGDGHIYKHGEPTYGSVNKELIRDIQILLNMVDIPSSINMKKKSNVYENHTTHDYALDVPNLFYSQCLKFFEESKLNYGKLKNYKVDKGKYNKVKVIDEDCFCVQIKEIKEITEEYKDNVYDLEINTIHKFISNDILVANTERYQNKSFFVCFPHFNELSTAFRNDRIMMRLYVYARSTKGHYASAIISLKDVNRFISDPWHNEDNARKYEDVLKGKPAALRTPDDILKAERKLKGYAGNFDIPELRKISPNIWRIYSRYKIENAQKELLEEEEVDKESVKWKWATRSLMEYIKKLHPELTVGELAAAMGMSTYVVSNLRSMKAPAGIEKTYRAIEDTVSVRAPGPTKIKKFNNINEVS